MLYFTQKAKGFNSLRHTDSALIMGQVDLKPLNKAQILPHEFDLSKLEFPLFARPCPVRPRHGFVESRMVTTNKAILKLFAETCQEEVNAEMILMPLLTGEWSGVMHTAGVDFGLENDGVTGGRRSFRVPVSAVAGKVTAQVGHHTNVRVGEEFPYIELVENNGKSVAVQVRAGPEQPAVRDYIPERVQVKNVVTLPASYDLLWWEEKVKTLTKNDVVLLPCASLSAHAAVHAILYKIPVMTTRAPVVGEWLEPSASVVSDLTQEDYEQLTRELAQAFYNIQAFRDRLSEIAYASVGCLHASAVWGSEPHLLRLRAQTVAHITYLMALACIGEMRHFSGDNPKLRIARTSGRTDIYQEALGITPPNLYLMMRVAAKDFKRDQYWERGYGGNGWSRAATLAANGLRASSRFMKKPSADTWNQLWALVNQMVNQAHNNGYILDKWIEQGSYAMNSLAEAPQLGLISATVADAVFARPSFMEFREVESLWRFPRMADKQFVLDLEEAA